MRMLITVLLKITKNWKQSACPSTSEWIIKLWDIHTIDLQFSNKKEFLYMPTWLTFKSIMLSERSRARKAIYGIIPFL